MKYLITGATGNLGEKVTRWLRTMTSEDNIRVGIHNLKKADKFSDLAVEKVKLDYFDLDTLEKAVDGIDLVIYIPSITYNLQKRITEFENILQVVKKAKTKLIFVVFSQIKKIIRSLCHHFMHMFQEDLLAQELNTVL